MLAAPETTATAIIVAAGSGSRMGSPDKVIQPLAGRPLMTYCIDAAETARSVGEIVLVVAPHIEAETARIVANGRWTKVSRIVLGGARRQDSVEAGLDVVAADCSIVAIHDAARPLVTSLLFDECVDAAVRAGAAIAAVPVNDTLKRVRDLEIIDTVDREHLWAAQTPQAFRIDLIRAAFRYAREQALTVTDESRLFELQGWPVAIVPSSARNFKITRPFDMLVAEALLRLPEEAL
jgi:2-C-methyl-D-erythritol 4-phosphate cytidylyltransferase